MLVWIQSHASVVFIHCQVLHAIPQTIRVIIYVDMSSSSRANRSCCTMGGFNRMVAAKHHESGIIYAGGILTQRRPSVLARTQLRRLFSLGNA
jgi:hypothetical protein